LDLIFIVICTLKANNNLFFLGFSSFKLFCYSVISNVSWQ